MRTQIYCSDLLLHVEPHNRQAQSLRDLIDAAETKEGYIGESVWANTSTTRANSDRALVPDIGIGLVAGAAAVGGILVAGLLKRARR